MTSKNSTQTHRAERAPKSGDDTVTRLRKRAIQAESAAQTQADTPQASETKPATMSIGGLQIPNLQLGNLEGTVRSAVKYAQENPLAVAAMALGVGGVLTSMCWGQAPETRGRRGKRRSR